MSKNLETTNPDTETKQPTLTYWLGFDTAKVKMDYSLIDQQGLEQTYGIVRNTIMDIVELLLTIDGNYPGATVYCVKLLIPTTTTCLRPVRQLMCRVLSTMLF